LEDLGVDGRITLKWIIMKQGARTWTGRNRLRIGASGWLL